MAQTALRTQGTADTADHLIAKFARGLGDTTRIRIVRFLLGGPRTVSEIVAHLGLGQSRISNHLACLKWCGYVDTERNGRTVIYRVADERVRTILDLCREVVADNASHLATCMVIQEEAK